MKITMAIFVLLITFTILQAQLDYNGCIRLQNMFTLKNQSEITLPFRIAELELSYTYGNFDLKTNSALEYKWTDQNSKYRLREAYLIWYPNFGEVSIGKQIFAWGMADGNNPTDNLSPYDFHYMFLTGIDRKIGTISAATTIYWDNWQIEGVIIPEHEPNRIVYDKDFPIKPPFSPADSLIQKIDDDVEYGFQIQTYFGNNDLALSFFSGHDRMFSLFGKNMEAQPPDTLFGYRKTNVIGLNSVSLFGDFIFRNEIGYFDTKTETDTESTGSVTLFQLSAEYFQYVSQIEYTGFGDFTLTVQLIGHHNQKIDTENENMKKNFQHGTGTPFATIFDQVLSFSLTSVFWDNSLEIRFNSIINAKEQGYIFGSVVSYSPLDNCSIELNISKFIGDETLDQNYIFNKLESFSNFQLSLKYSF